jgi:hypothetical protein
MLPWIASDVTKIAIDATNFRRYDNEDYDEGQACKFKDSASLTYDIYDKIDNPERPYFLTFYWKCLNVLTAGTIVVQVGSKTHATITVSGQCN